MVEFKPQSIHLCVRTFHCPTRMLFFCSTKLSLLFHAIHHSAFITVNILHISSAILGFNAYLIKFFFCTNLGDFRIAFYRLLLLRTHRNQQNNVFKWSKMMSNNAPDRKRTGNFIMKRNFSSHWFFTMEKVL